MLYLWLIILLVIDNVIIDSDAFFMNLKIKIKSAHFLEVLIEVGRVYMCL
jgi:hypothetical protein